MPNTHNEAAKVALGGSHLVRLRCDRLRNTRDDHVCDSVAFSSIRKGRRIHHPPANNLYKTGRLPEPGEVSRRGSELLGVQDCALHSITSSARARSVGGTARPSALAVLRLTHASQQKEEAPHRGGGPRTTFKSAWSQLGRRAG